MRLWYNKKGQILSIGFSPLGCDYNQISKEFKELISTDLLEMYRK